MAEQKSFQATFQLVNETKGALRYGEVLAGGKLASQPNEPGSRIGVLYIRKTAFNGSGWPKQLAITANYEV